MYQATTRQLRISVQSEFLEHQSQPENNQYFWAYTVTIENMGQETVQLQNRFWHITDALGQVQEVRGMGVVGEQPVLEPGDSFSYTSGTPLATPSGVMRGHYSFTNEKRETFAATIPAFSLDSPYQPVRLN
ncbi:MAG: Co2+/Mg2+ efflux protein ApaG [Alphaproteobacteria bacterium]|nr:Co2+/Mg2+ efflux protein ApaG [Alphaproteobacteria bacterium]